MSKWMIRAVAVTTVGLASGRALAEASHHQGASAGQVAGAVQAAQLESLASTSEDVWQFRAFPSYLRATRAFDDDGMALRMPSGTRVENYTLNAYVERRLGERSAISALTGWQELRLRESGADRTVSSLSDSFLAARHGAPTSWGGLAGIVTLKLPGTYPESALTSTKQVDAQLEVLASLRPSRWLSLVGGGGYRLRFGGVQDELTATLLLPLGMTDGLTLTPSLLAAVPVGLGDVAKNAATAGASLGWRVARRLDLTAAYYRTVYGRNVVQADVWTFGAGASL